MSDKGKIIAIFQNQEFTFAKTEITDDDMIKVGDGVHHGTILIVELDGGVIFPFGMEPGEKEAKIAIWLPFHEIEKVMFKTGIIETDPEQYKPPYSGTI